MSTNKQDWSGGYASIFKCLGASNHTDGEREQNDYYATDPMAIDALASMIELPHKIWEPSCGDGHLAKRLIELGKDVVSTDLIDRGYGQGGVDFFATDKMPDNCDCIITNPPYKFATEYVLHALDLLPIGGMLAMFLKASFLEGKERKKKIYDVTPPKWLFPFSQRIMCAKNGDFEGMKKVSSAVAYAWFVWVKGDYNNTTIKWI